MVRQSVAENVKKMKEKLGTEGGLTEDNVAMETKLKAEGMKDIQQENAELSKLVCKLIKIL